MSRSNAGRERRIGWKLFLCASALIAAAGFLLIGKMSPGEPVTRDRSERLAVARDGGPDASGELEAIVRAEAAGMPARDRRAQTKIMPGQLTLRLIDALSGVSPQAAVLTCLSETRTAKGRSEGQVTEVVLSQGVYEVSVHAPGYEAVELHEIELRSGQVTDLGFVALRRGSGVIEGKVSAPTVRKDATVVVKLFGDGRNPCAERADGDRRQRLRPCVSCGYSAHESVLQLRPGDPFRFSRLAAGAYTLRAYVMQEQSVGVVRQLELNRGQHSFSDLLIPGLSGVTFHLRDSSGQPLAESHLLGRSPDPNGLRLVVLVELTLHALGSVVARIRLDPELNRSASEAATQTHFAPPLAELLMPTSSPPPPVFSQRFGGERHDRERTERDTLQRSLAPPPARVPRLKSTRISQGVYVVDNVPMNLLELEASTNDGRCGRLKLDNRFSPAGQVVVIEFQDLDPHQPRMLSISPNLRILAGTIGHQSASPPPDRK